jgi:hypothetical protein
MRLFQVSFTPEMAHSAMNSKWCSRRNCAIEIEMSPEAAALLTSETAPLFSRTERTSHPDARPTVRE